MLFKTTNDFVEKDYTVDSWKAFKRSIRSCKRCFTK